MRATRSPQAPLPWSRVAFVADLLEEGPSRLIAEDRFDLERTSVAVLAEVRSAFDSLGLEHRHFNSPASLAAAIAELGNAVVFSTYAGARSRSRLTLVPAIAESLGLDFVGLDAMGQALAHDKQVMKRIAQDCGLRTPLSRVVRDDPGAQICLAFPTPFVVKPLMEGSSMGIAQDNIIHDGHVGVAKVRALLARFAQPVLVEAFVGGREVSFISIEAESLPHQAFVEVVVENEPDYFATRLFAADEKLNRKLPRRICRIDGDLSETDRAAIESLLGSIGQYGAVRVDGKLDDGCFHFIELTPDPWLGSTGHLAQAFILKGWSYADVIRALLASAARAPRGRRANG